MHGQTECAVWRRYADTQPRATHRRRDVPARDLPAHSGQVPRRAVPQSCRDEQVGHVLPDAAAREQGVRGAGEVPHGSGYHHRGELAAGFGDRLRRLPRHLAGRRRGPDAGQVRASVIAGVYGLGGGRENRHWRRGARLRASHLGGDHGRPRGEDLRVPGVASPRGGRDGAFHVGLHGPPEGLAEPAQRLRPLPPAQHGALAPPEQGLLHRPDGQVRLRRVHPRNVRPLVCRGLRLHPPRFRGLLRRRAARRVGQGKNRRPLRCAVAPPCRRHGAPLSQGSVHGRGARVRRAPADADEQRLHGRERLWHLRDPDECLPRRVPAVRLRGRGADHRRARARHARGVAGRQLGDDAHGPDGRDLHRWHPADLGLPRRRQVRGRPDRAPPARKAVPHWRPRQDQPAWHARVPRAQR
mmetsp:Transcript_66378/g.192328  ORF Transcript_66378/g.192328 Transcript_66378/m.192328 type:complete len:412 (+) Transcript_66378:2583-3818(+)